MHQSSKCCRTHFGVLKGRFRILLLPYEYGLEIQVRIILALCHHPQFHLRIHDSADEAINTSGDHGDGEHI